VFCVRCLSCPADRALLLRVASIGDVEVRMLRDHLAIVHADKPHERNVSDLLRHYLVEQRGRDEQARSSKMRWNLSPWSRRSVP
jgi:hypothetical protein